MPPSRVLFLRPDTYGDLFLFEPVPRIIRHAWPQTEVAVLIRERYADIVPLIGSPGVRWLTTTCDPYRKDPANDPAALEALRETVQTFAPDLVVAACTEQSWLEAAVGAFLPDARQTTVAPGPDNPVTRTALANVLPVEWTALYPEKIAVDSEMPEWDKNLRVTSALLGEEAPRWWPAAHPPLEARARAGQIVADAGLSAGQYVACAAAGIANVQIKAWPVANYGETLAWLERERGVRALLIGHDSERDRLEAVREAARACGGDPAIWTGRDGEMPVVAAVLESARIFLGNDTGALHLAAALGRPVVPIFGGGHWPRFQPVAARGRTVVQPLPCFGCAWDCYFVDAPCVRTISTASVRQALQEVLDDDAERNVVVEADGLDAGARALIETATPRLRFLRRDSADRLRQTVELSLQTSELSRRLEATDADRAARLEQIEELTTLLQTSEADREDQTRNLTALLSASEADRDARLQQVEELTEFLRTSDADRAARQHQVSDLTALLAASEADRDARFKQVEELTALLAVSESDRTARFEQIEELAALLQTSEADRAARLTCMNELAASLETAAADRAGLLRQIEALHAPHPDDDAADSTVRSHAGRVESRMADEPV